jgi:hypothetical protein
MAVRMQQMAGPEGPPDGSAALPAEVLAAPVGDGRLFVERVEDWRRALGWSHARFAAYLGISRNYWWLLRTHQRDLTIGVAQRVLRERPEFEYFLGAAIRGRRWGHQSPGERAGPREEATREGG